jgi:hypothetical protein
MTDYHNAVIETARRAFNLARAFEDSQIQKPIYIEGPISKTLSENPSLSESELRTALNEFSRQVFHGEISPLIIQLIKERNKLYQ